VFAPNHTRGHAQPGDPHNDRLVSLRKTRLVKIADEGGRATYRLLGIPHVSSARATFTFVVNGPGSGASTTWRRG